MLQGAVPYLPARHALGDGRPRKHARSIGRSSHGVSSSGDPWKKHLMFDFVGQLQALLTAEQRSWQRFQGYQSRKKAPLTKHEWWWFFRQKSAAA
jgi:hypothetical protein